VGATGPPDTCLAGGGGRQGGGVLLTCPTHPTPPLHTPPLGCCTAWYAQGDGAVHWPVQPVPAQGILDAISGGLGMTYIIPRGATVGCKGDHLAAGQCRGH
jgi:hypothetical protein